MPGYVMALGAYEHFFAYISLLAPFWGYIGIAIEGVAAAIIVGLLGFYLDRHTISVSYRNLLSILCIIHSSLIALSLWIFNPHLSGASTIYSGLEEYEFLVLPVILAYLLGILFDYRAKNMKFFQKRRYILPLTTLVLFLLMVVMYMFVTRLVESGCSTSESSPRGYCLEAL